MKRERHQPPTERQLTWRWAVVTGTVFLGIFVMPILGFPGLGSLCIVLLVLCVMYAMGLFGRRRDP